MKLGRWLLTGTDAAKPAAGLENRFYWATDTEILYRDNGSSWVETARGESVTRLAQLSDRAHSSLSGVSSSDHHDKTGDYEVYPLTEGVTSLPAADADHLGRIYRVRSGAGAKTTVYICVLNDDDGYEYIQIGIST